MVGAVARGRGEAELQPRGKPASCDGGWLDDESSMLGGGSPAEVEARGGSPAGVEAHGDSEAAAVATRRRGNT